MYDKSHDTHQDVFCGFAQSSHSRRLSTAVGKGALGSLSCYPVIPINLAQDVSATAQIHLLYTRFNSVSTQLATLLFELERRALAHPEELSALLSECHAAYFTARKSLLVGRITEEIKGLDPARTELVELVCFLSSLSSTLPLNVAIIDQGRLQLFETAMHG